MTAPARPWEAAPAAGPQAAVAAAHARLVPELLTRRLRLRAPVIADFDAFAALRAADGRIDRRSSWLEFCQLVASWPLRGFGPWSIENRGLGAWLGLVLLDHEYGDAEPEIGWFIAPDDRRRGFAVEAARAVLGHAFSALRFTTLVAYVDRQNTASIRVAERLGGRRDDVAAAATGDPAALVYRFTPRGAAS